MFLVNRLVSHFSIRKNDRKFVNRMRNFFSTSSRNYQLAESNSPNYSTNNTTHITSHHVESMERMKNDIFDDLFNYNGYTDESGPGLAETMPSAARRLRMFMEAVDVQMTWNYTHGIMLIRLCEELIKYESNGNREPTADEYRKIYAMAWCFELFFANAAIHDDVVDYSDVRRGKAAWYQQNICNNNLEIAIYNSCLFENASRLLTYKYFASQPFYYDIEKIFTDMHVTYQWGILMDALVTASQWPSEKIADTYLYDLYKRRVTLAISNFLSGPLKLALHTVNKYDKKTAAQIDQVGNTFSIIYQTYDDCSEVYGTAQKNREPCNDIGIGIRSFPVVLAYKYANEHQRNIILEHYGKNNADSVAAVMEVYRQLSLESKCEEQEKLITRRLNDQIANVDDEAVRNVLSLICNSLHEWHH